MKAFLCSKAWEVFNDDKIKQILIFLNDGNLMISTDGNVVKSSWQYIPANHSIIIDSIGKAEMLLPIFTDDNLLVLLKDGRKADSVYIMIDSQKTHIFPDRTLSELNNYFQEKERLLLEAKEKEFERKTVTGSTSYSLDSPFNWETVVALCFFFGFLGVHRFYVGKNKTGKLMLFTLGGFGLWWFGDLLSILCRTFRDKQGRIVGNRSDRFLYRR